MRHIIFLNGIWPNKSSTAGSNFTRAISCYQLKHWLSHFGFKSQVIDFCQLLTADEIFSLLEQFVSSDTLAIGVSTTFWPTDKVVPSNLLEIFSRAKEKWPHLKIISGGARKTWNPEIFDKHFIGESENQLVEWCQGLVNKSSLLNKKFNIVSLEHRFDDTDAILEEEALPIELGRGCIFKCKFCSHHNLGKSKFTYQRDFDLILDELRYNYENFSTTKYMFLDDTVNEDLDKIRNLANARDALGFNLEWTGYLRADLVWSKTESAELLAKSGLRSCFFGIETFHPAAGKSIDKGWGSKHGKEYIPKLYNKIWDKKINIHINLIAGLPHEPLDSLHESLKWCKENDIGRSRFVPLTLYVEKDDDFASSEFTKNYPLYGYKNVNHETGYWELETINSVEALEFCKKAEISLNSVGRVSSWDVFNVTNLGYKTEDAMNFKYATYATIIYRQRNKFKDRYLNKLRSLIS